jgi:arginine-tRNA-protein transferase
MEIRSKKGALATQEPQLRSVVQLYGDQVSSCGYCKPNNSPTSRSFGVVSTRMLAEDYERLMLVGWRRSGTYFYKPTMHLTCCPQYPIRLDVEKFAPSKSQKLVLRRLERYLATGEIRVDNATPTTGSEKAEVTPPSESTKTPISSGSTKVLSVKSDLSVSAPSTGTPPDTANLHSLTVDTVPAEFTSERFELYKKYQQNVHNDAPEEVTPEGFTRFLVTSPLVSTSKKYGTFHQLYRLDGKLVAVGVVDVLPSGLSSVYVFYDPDSRDLVLGKVTALREIDFCRSQELKYYYMGFYIHSCVKMRYKGEYRPSELLCPTTLRWYPLADATSLLNQAKFIPLESSLAQERLQLLPGSSTGEAETQQHVAGSNSKPTASNENLSKFAPRFPGLPTGSASAKKSRIMSIFKSLWLEIHGQAMEYDMLNERGKQILDPYLKEWIEHCGPEIAVNIGVSF